MFVRLYPGSCDVCAKSAAEMRGRFEKKVLMKITSLIVGNGMWRWSKNKEFYEVYEDISISSSIRIERLEYLENIFRMKNSR